ncbi:MAG: hypothetical protein HY529_01870 [Chloroflexi bacterium]|nr:hypothetical protein [Chloroflexota bacterium]
MDLLLKVPEHCFGLGDGHVKINPPSGEFILGILEKDYGLKPHAIKILPPYDDYSAFQINVLWDKGRLDLRILTRLQSEVNSVSKLKCANVELVSLCIIPRSRETMVSKLIKSL